ncbi:acyl carrier protein 3, mitochondrial [Typha latifolia]|uniref:acyl carrier protein 3, mitochondrial n=1 Tax=Typha latifolia TaxID=4733 RepID=UPI003C2ADF76
MNSSARGCFLLALDKMQHVRKSILRHVRLSCYQQPSASTLGGSPLSGTSRYMCISSKKTSSEHIMARVLQLVKKYDKIDGTKVTESADFQKDLCLDSLDRVELIMAVEQEFSIEIPDDKADKLSCCSDVVKYILSEAQSSNAESS